uniref:PorV/PorQ family protein n=1 Tax=candidate division WOR-3 bacterium TaxID=2052148 RepID=A0A7C4GGE9_UNCW3
MATHVLLLAFLTAGWPAGSGTTAFPLLRVPLGPRACAMGEAYTGLADDVNALFWNPAGLGQVAASQLAFSHQEWFADIRDEHLGLVLPVGSGSLGVGLVFSTTSGIEVRDPESGDHTETSAHSGYAALGYGLMLNDRLHVGISAKGLYDDLIEQTGAGVCFDAGVLLRAERFRLGCAARNLGWGMRYGQDNIALPMGLHVGASYALRRLNVVADISASVDRLPDAHLGFEYPLYDIFMARAGCRLGPQDWRTLSWTSALTTGFGINLGRFALDYAFVPYGRLGLTHRLSLRTTLPGQQFGRVRIQVRELGTGAPVVATFLLEGSQQGNSYTEPDGTFTIEGVEPGWLKVTASAERFYPQTESVLVEPRRTHTLRIVVSRSGYGALWGVVYSADRRRPLSARIEYSGPESGSLTTTEKEGSFTLRKLRAGAYRLEIVPADTTYLAQSETLTVTPGQLTSRTLFCSPRSGFPTAPAPNDGEPRREDGEPEGN